MTCNALMGTLNRAHFLFCWWPWPLCADKLLWSIDMVCVFHCRWTTSMRNTAWRRRWINRASWLASCRTRLKVHHGKRNG